MKKLLFMIPAVLLLSSCGDTSLIDSVAGEQTDYEITTVSSAASSETVTSAATDTPTVLTSGDNDMTEAPVTTEETSSVSSESEITEKTTAASSESEITEETAEKETEADDDTADSTATEESESAACAEPDLDLTGFDSNMVYATVYDMMFNGDNYLGQIIKARGSFGYYKAEETGKEYFAILISDASACCSQGIEFVLDGDHTYPDDYPALGSDLTVTGEFDYYTEGRGIYIQLLHADIQVNESSDDTVTD